MKIVEIIKYIMVFVGFAGMLWGVFELIDTLRDNDRQQAEFQNEIINAVKENSCKSDSILNLLNATNIKVNQNTEAIRTYQSATRYYIEHQAEMTREQQIDLFDYFTEKIKRTEFNPEIVEIE